jgi:hypothetical protein
MLLFIFWHFFDTFMRCILRRARDNGIDVDSSLAHLCFCLDNLTALIRDTESLALHRLGVDINGNHSDRAEVALWHPSEYPTQLVVMLREGKYQNRVVCLQT